MNKLTSQYKGFLFTKFLIGSTLLCTFFLYKWVYEDPRKSVSLLLFTPGDDTFSPECLSQKSSLRTPLGDYPLSLQRDPEQKKLTLKIGEHSFLINTPLPPPLCEKVTSLPYFKTILEEAAPACQTRFDKDGFSCQIFHETRDSIAKKMRALKFKILKRSKRVPYPLSRRLTLNENLARTLKKTEWEQSLETFCKLLDASHPSEKTLILNNKAWKESLCHNEDTKQRYLVAHIALQKSLEEIQYLYNLAKDLNVSGTLRIYVEKSLIPTSGNVWIEVHSTTDHRKRLLTSVMKLRKVSFNNTVPKTCWFPGKTLEKISATDILNLWGDEKASTLCSYEEEDIPMRIIDEIFAPLSSESFFEISSGRFKSLSLPKGTYTYSVFASPEKLGDGVNNLIQKGSLDWKSRRKILYVRKNEGS